MLLRRSMALRQVIDSSQVRNCDSPRNVSSLLIRRHERLLRDVVGLGGRADAARAARNTARRFRSTSSPNASMSPACARRTRSRSVAAAGSVPVTRSIDCATAGSGWENQPWIMAVSRLELRIRQMLNHEQLLKLIRDKVDHPATPRELLQRLKLPREQRATFKRLLGDLVESGAWSRRAATGSACPTG